MKFNQFSYIPVSPEMSCQELRSLGFEVSLDASAKANFEAFVRKYFLFFEDTDLALKNWIADTETDLLTFFQSDRPLTAEVFGLVALQMLGFVPNVDFTDSVAFLEKMAFPITFDGSLNNLHQLLATRTQSGNTLIDQLVAQDLIPISNGSITLQNSIPVCPFLPVLVNVLVKVTTSITKCRNPTFWTRLPWFMVR